MIKKFGRALNLKANERILKDLPETHDDPKEVVKVNTIKVVQF